MSLNDSLRYRFLMPLLLGGVVVSLIGSVYAYRTTLAEADRALLEEGVAIASALNHAAMVAHNASEEQHVVEEVYKDAGKLSLALLVSDGKVSAATIPEWIGLKVSSLPDPELVQGLNASASTGGEMLRSDVSADGRYRQIVMPLEASLSDHDHEHSTSVIDHLGARAAPAPGKVHIHADGKRHDHGSPAVAVADPPPPAVAGHYGERPGFLARDTHKARGQILILLDRKPVEELVRANTLRIASGMSAAVAVTMLIAFLLMTRRVLTPLAAIGEAMRRRQTGDKQSRAEIRGNDELARLGATLNGMLETLGRQELDMNRLSQAVEQSPVSVVITNLEGVIEYANPRFCESTGYTRDELIGETPARIKSGLTPSQTYNEMWETIRAGKRWQGELHNRNKAGDLYWENVTISPIFDEGGRIIQYLGIKEDISVRKEYEEKLVRQANFD
ncbi:MAG TPA: PAS domain S-box protein, partial [Rhodocyclaceae bacterium]